MSGRGDIAQRIEELNSVDRKHAAEAIKPVTALYIQQSQ